MKQPWERDWLVPCSVCEAQVGQECRSLYWGFILPFGHDERLLGHNQEKEFQLKEQKMLCEAFGGNGNDV